MAVDGPREPSDPREPPDPGEPAAESPADAGPSSDASDAAGAPTGRADDVLNDGRPDGDPAQEPGDGSTDGAATDDAATDGAATDGAATDGAATDGAGTDGAATDAASPAEPAGAPPSPEPDDALARPAFDPWLDETVERPAGALPPSYPDGPDFGAPVEPPSRPVGPSGTGILPPVGDPPIEPRWSARAQVRPPDSGHSDLDEEEWGEPERSVLTPILLTVAAIILIGLIVLGAVLLLSSRDTPPVLPSPSETGQVTSVRPSTATTTTAAPTTSSLPAEVAIPDVRDLDFDAASAKLRDAGLVPARRDEIDGQLPAGRVTGTDPPAGTQVRTGTTITIIVSRGLPTPTTTTAVPTVPQTTPGPTGT